MADGVDASVQAVETAGGEPVGDRALRDAQGGELGGREHAVLAPRER